jgi:hypothetical protein
MKKIDQFGNISRRSLWHDTFDHRFAVSIRTSDWRYKNCPRQRETYKPKPKLKANVRKGRRQTALFTRSFEYTKSIMGNHEVKWRSTTCHGHSSTPMNPPPSLPSTKAKIVTHVYIQNSISLLKICFMRPVYCPKHFLDSQPTPH